MDLMCVDKYAELIYSEMYAAVVCIKPIKVDQIVKKLEMNEKYFPYAEFLCVPNQWNY